MSAEEVPPPPAGIGAPGTHPQAPPGAAPPSGDPARDRRLRNATTFLNNAQVKASPLSRRVNFLKSKGLSAEEISEAFTRVGQNQSVETINNIINNHNTASSSSQPAASAPAAPAAPQGHAVVPSQPGAPQVVYVQQPHPQQHPPLPTPPPAQSGLANWGWKDYFIGATVAAAGATLAVKAAQHFLPYSIVRKDGEEDWLAGGAPTSPTRSKRRSERRSRRDVSDDYESSDVASRRRSSKRTPTTVEPSQTFGAAVDASPTPVAAPAATASAPANNIRVEELEKELEAAKTSSAELQEKLDKERKDKAEMAMNNGKIRAQVTQLSRTNEKQGAEVARLTKANGELKEELEKLRAEASLNGPAKATGEDGAAATDAEADGASSAPQGTEAAGGSDEKPSSPPEAVDTAPPTPLANGASSEGQQSSA